MAASAAVANNGGTSSTSVVPESSATAFPSNMTTMTTTREEDAEDDMDNMLLGLRRNHCRGIVRVSRRQRFWVAIFRARANKKNYDYDVRLGDLSCSRLRASISVSFAASVTHTHP